MGPIMNLISNVYHLCDRTHHSCERKITYLFVILRLLSKVTEYVPVSSTCNTFCCGVGDLDSNLTYTKNQLVY